MENLMDQMKRDFIADASETVDKISRRLAALKPDEPIARSEIDRVFRTAHSLKGTAGMFELHAVSRVAESIENVLDVVRGGALAMSPQIVDMLLEAFDELMLLFKGGGGAGGASHAEAVTKKIDDFLEAYLLPREESTPDRSMPVHIDVGPAAAEAPAVQPDADEVGLASQEAPLCIKVDIRLLDSMMNTISELYSARVGLLGVANRLPKDGRTRRLRDDLLKLSLLLNKRISNLEESITSVRLVPISMLFERYRGEVRRLARQSGKNVNLAFEGQSTKVDRALLERLYDPLLHIIRNAVDHGIEPEAERRAGAKLPQGTILVRARQDANHVRIDIEDDGRGIQTEKIRSIAMDKGIVPESDQSLLSVLFKPGFSTKEDADEISGRGVGLDVVKTRIEALRGMVNIETSPGGGTRFSIWVPLTLAVSTGILVQEADVPVIIPLGSVIEVLRLGQRVREEISTTGLLRYGDVDVGAVALTELLKTGPSRDERFAVLVGVGEMRRAIIAHQVCGETEIVSRPLPGAIRTLPFIAGAAELSDGRTAIIIQPEEILRDVAVAWPSSTGRGDFSLAKESKSIREWKRRGLLRLLVFRASGDLYAVPVALLKEVIPVRSLTRIPVLGDEWQGLFFARGMCHGLLKIPPSGLNTTDASRMIILKSPEGCGIGARDVLGHLVIPYAKVVAARPESRATLVAAFGNFEWKGNTVSILDIGGILRGATGEAKPERLMHGGSADDRQVEGCHTGPWRDTCIDTEC